ncbi:MAG: chromosome segregation ATPase [Chitinophagales bacterium]|jgi:chromosome segregation ATPase
MSSSASRLIVIQKQVEKLLEKIALLKNEKNDLNSSNLALKKEIELEKTLFDNLNQKLQTLKLAKSISGDDKPQETTELKRKINDYIKEIDRCITLLNG